MKHYRALLSFIGLLVLSGCDTYYIPPTSGPTATFDVKIHNVFGVGILYYLPNDDQTAKDVIIKNLDHRDIVTARVAMEPKYTSLLYYEATSKATCSVSLSFVAAANVTYDIFAGDLPPPAPVTLAQHLNQFINPTAGGRCFGDIKQVMPDGSLKEIPSIW